jgi:hypothetical protein
MNVTGNNKFLYFNDAADFATANNMGCYPISAIKGFRNVSATVLNLELAPLLSNSDSNDTTIVNDTLAMTIVSGTHKSVIESILNELTFGSDVNVVVFDTISSKSITSNITSIALTVGAEA